jgi:hypothetical protein
VCAPRFPALHHTCALFNAACATRGRYPHLTQLHRCPNQPRRSPPLATVTRPPPRTALLDLAWPDLSCPMLAGVCAGTAASVARLREDAQQVIAVLEERGYLTQQVSQVGDEQHAHCLVVGWGGWRRQAVGGCVHDDVGAFPVGMTSDLRSCVIKATIHRCVELERPLRAFVFSVQDLSCRLRYTEWLVIAVISPHSYLSAPL